MRRWLLLAVAAIGFALAEEHKPAEAAHSGQAAQVEAHGEGMPHEIWWKWANFALLVIVLAWLWRKHATPFFAARADAIRKGIEDAAQAKADAEARAAEMERKLAALSSEVEALRARSRNEIAVEGERIRRETEQQLARIQAQAEQEIAAASRLASQELKAYAAELAIQLAEQQLKGSMTPERQHGLIRRFAEELDGKAAHS